MYNTHIVRSADLPTFDVNLLSKFDHYVFVVVSSTRDFELAVRKVGKILASCGSLCFLLDEQSFHLLEGNEIVHSLFDSARASAPKDAISFVAAITKNELLSSHPRGTWHELFLGLEKSNEDREKKLVAAIQKTLSDKPRDYSTYGPVVGKFIGWMLGSVIRPHP